MEFLQPMFETNELWLNKAIANFLNDDGFFSNDDQCFEQLACQIFNDQHNNSTMNRKYRRNTKHVAASM